MNTDEEKVKWCGATTFDFTNTPTSAGAVHEYTIDGDALAEGEKGVTMKIDSDGDGSFERLFIYLVSERAKKACRPGLGFLSE